MVRTFTPAFAPGRNEVVWDGKNDRGSRVSPGVYFCRLTADQADLSQRLVYVH